MFKKKLIPISTSVFLISIASVNHADSDIDVLANFSSQTNSYDTSWFDKHALKLGVANDQDEKSVLTFGLMPTFTSEQWLFRTSALGDTLDDGKLGITEIFLAYIPTTQSAWSSQLKTGFFFAPFSLENREQFWLSAYTLTPSAINSWLGEEMRTLGSEYSLDYKGEIDNNFWRVTTSVAAFEGNDPAGSLLAWRGFALHSRIARYNEVIALPEYSFLHSTGSFPKQSKQVEPFKEIDNRTGWYGGIRISFNKNTQWAFWHYDNRGIPIAFKDGQYAWHTRFELFSFRQQFQNHWELLAQHMKGSTLMGASLTKVDNDFSSSYLLISKNINQHILSIRFDHFSIDDKDQTIDDNNEETGKSITLAWLVNIQENWRLGAEWLTIKSTRPQLSNIGIDAEQDDQQVAISARFRW